MLKVWFIVLIVMNITSCILWGINIFRKKSNQVGIRCERCNSLIKNAAKNKYQMNIAYPDYITGRKIMGTHEFVDCPFCGRQTIIGRRIYEEKKDAEDNDTGEAAGAE